MVLGFQSFLYTLRMQASLGGPMLKEAGIPFFLTLPAQGALIILPTSSQIPISYHP